MNQKQALPLAKEWLEGDIAARTRIQQSLKGTKALMALLDAIAVLAPASAA
jgi:hypothetical protein